LTFTYGPPVEVPRYTLYPLTPLDVLASHDRLTVCWIVAPEPLTVSEAEFELLKKEMFAEALPAVVGAKVMENGTLCPDAMVTGNASPARVKAELLELADETVTLPPDAVMLPFCVWGLPTVTVPKLSDPGVTASVPLELVPLPARATDTEGFEAFELTESVALFVPVVTGENVMARLALVPAARE
jgi:hypothetical protein